MRIGYLLPQDSQLGAGAVAFANEVERRSQGRVQIDQYPDASLGGEVEMLRGVQLGAIDLAFITGAPLPSILPEAGIFNIPFLFRNYAHAHTVLDGPIGDSYLRSLCGKDLVALAWGENGMRHLTNSKRPVASPDDIKGLKLRLPQSPVMTLGFQLLGAEVVRLPFPQVYAALEAGVVDGQENPIATIDAANFGQVQKFLSMTGHVYDPAVIVMSSDAFGDLSSEDQAIFVEAAKLGARASRAFAIQAETAGLATLRKGGLQIIDSVERSRFVAVIASASAKFEAMFGRRQIEEIRLGA